MSYDPPNNQNVDFELELYTELDADEVDFTIRPPSAFGNFAQQIAFTSDKSGSAQGAFNLAGTFTSDKSGSAQGAFGASASFTSDKSGQAVGTFTIPTIKTGIRSGATADPISISIGFSAPIGGGAAGSFGAELAWTAIRSGDDGTFTSTFAFDGIRSGATALPAAATITFSAPIGGGAAGSFAASYTADAIRSGDDGTITTQASFDAIRSGATALPTASTISFTSDTGGSAQAAFSTPITFSHGPHGDDFAVVDATVSFGGRPLINGLFSAQTALQSDPGGSAQANFASTLTAAVQTQTAQPFTQPLAPTLAASGDNDPLGTQQTQGIFLALPDYGGTIAPSGVQAYTFTPGMEPVSAQSDVAPVAWQVTINQEEVVDDVYDVDVIDTANPFGSYAVIYADDVTGNTFEKFNRGTRVDIAYSDNAGITFENRFTGYVVESREYDEQGADALEVECYTFDQFLRRNTVSNDQTGNTIQQALGDIIQTDTPVNFVPDNIEVGSNVTLSRSYRGDPVEDVLRALSFKSVNEEFGVNRDVEFFFRPRESEHNARGVDDTQWLNYDIPELGKDAVNEVVVFFDEGSRSVTIDDGDDKLNLKDNLALPRAGVQSVELSRPAVTSISDAEDEGRRYIDQRNNVLSGTVTTFGLFEIEPGDTIDVEIKPRGISGEFRVAEVRYNWAYSETDLTLVEKRGATDDVLFRISDSVKRIETAQVNRDAVKDKILKNDYEVVTTVTDNLDQWDEVAATNVLFNKLRDGLINEETITISEVRFGDDPSNLSRTNTDLEGQEVASFTANTGNWVNDISTYNILGLSFESSETATANEVGLFDSDGDLLIRLISGSGVRANEIDWDISFTDGETSRTVVTQTGQKLFRDILADNDPVFLQTYKVGEGDPDSPFFDIREEDTDLDDRFPGSLGEVDLGTFFVDQYDTVEEWESVFVPDVYEDDFPIGVFSGQSLGQVNLLSNGYYIEAEQANDGITGTAANWSGAEEQYGVRSVNLNSSGEFVQHQFLLARYQHRADKMTVHAPFYLNNFTGDFIVSISVNDGPFVEVRSQSFSNSDGGYNIFGSAFLDNFGFTDSDFDPDNTDPFAVSVKVRAEVQNVSGVGQLYLDFLQVNDELDRRGIPRYRKLSPYDPEAYGFNAGNLLSEHNPVTLQFNQISTPIEFDQLSLETDVVGSDFFVNVEGPEGNFDGPVTEFKLAASNDGGQTFLETQNDTDPTFDFAESGDTIDLKVTLDGYWDRGESTPFEDSPPTANEGMDLRKMVISLGTESLTKEGIGGVNARAIFRPQTITAGGDEVTEGGLFNSEGDMVCRTIAIAPFDPGSNTRVSTDDTITITGAN